MTQTELPVDMAGAERVLDELGPVGRGDLIPLLQKIQDEYGYLPAAVLKEVSERTDIPTSGMYGVITFYSQFHTKPHGRHTVRCCRGTACHVKGSRSVALVVKRLLNVDEGETTEDLRFTFETVACLGTCFLAPVMMIDSDYYGSLTPTRVKSILQSYK